MYNFYPSTTQCINKYNTIQYKMENLAVETSEVEDEFITNFCVYLAHALIKDTGTGQQSRQELCKTARIILDVCEE